MAGCRILILPSFSLGSVSISLYCLLFSSVVDKRSDYQFDSYLFLKQFVPSLGVYTICLLSFELREILGLGLGCFFS